VAQSPYENVPVGEWEQTTLALLRQHPLKPEEVVEVVLGSWNAIFASALGNYHIGKDIFPKPQIMGFFLHELIALEFKSRYPTIWRGDESGKEKDLVCITTPEKSVELKCSSHKSKIFGNRSYAQAQTDPKKSKSGYYIAINFEAFKKGVSKNPGIIKIRFGWLDHTDWVGQKSQTGQQASLKADSERYKLRTLFGAGVVQPGEDIFDLLAGDDAFG